MFRAFLALLMLAAVSCIGFGQPGFDRFFAEGTMRMDYYRTGTKGAETLALDAISEDGPWPGSREDLVDTLNLGEYLVRVFDLASGTLIFSRGYSTIFNEWQTTDEALAGVYRTFHETVRFPYPKQRVQVSIHRRDKRMVFHEIFTTVIDPNSPTLVNREKRLKHFNVLPLMTNGDPSRKVDILILGDGYRKADMEKFRKDARHFNDVMFSTSPFKERRKDFNVWAMEVESQESGIDKPDKGVWKSTALGTKYNTFGSARYVLTEENRALRDIAAAAPYDFITILINDDRYGGGGIFNLYTTTYTKADAPGTEWQMDYVYVHEFGHSFGGLGDEYYSSQVSYNEFYQKGVEPWEPNVTALVNPKELKWRAFTESGTPIPTPWEKMRYDSLEKERGKLDRLAPDYYQKREPLFQAAREVLKTTRYVGKVGAFEGSGYASEGLYRPAADCRMFTLSLGDFDPVCRASIERVIDFYSQ